MKFLIVLSFFGLVSLSCAKKFPSYITRCHRTDPKFKECFKIALIGIRPFIAKGIPEFHLPRMDPLILPEITLNNGDSFTAKFKDVHIYQSNNFNLLDLDIDLDKNHLEMLLNFPRLRIQSQYEINGKILFLNLNGKGPADGNFTDVTIKTVFDGHRITKGGKEYINFDKLYVHQEMGANPTLSFKNLFGDNTELNEAMNRIVNENIRDIVQELNPVIQNAMEKTVSEFVDRVFSRFSFDELFPK